MGHLRIFAFASSGAAMLTLLAIPVQNSIYIVYSATELQPPPAILTHKNIAKASPAETPPLRTVWGHLVHPTGKSKQSPKIKIPIWLAEITEFLGFNLCSIDSNPCPSPGVHHAHNYVNH